MATRLAPLIPFSVEQQLGDAVDAQVRAMLDTEQGRRGRSNAALDRHEKAGRAALDKLMGRLESAAALPIPLQVAVVRRNDANAIALPGGHIYVFDGLIDKAESPDEFAGVIAHEIGHVAHRDGTRSVLQAAGLSFLFGMLLGDFVGGGAVVIAAQDRAAVGLFARGRGGGRPLRRRPDEQGRRRSARARHDPGAHRWRDRSRHRRSCSIIRDTKDARRRDQRHGRRRAPAGRAAARRRPNGPR